MTQFSLEQNPLFQKILPEVKDVASDMPEFQALPINENLAKAITQRICEERNEDALEFWMFLSDIEELSDTDDWSDANGCIKNLIQKQLNEMESISA